ncbi:dynamin family protein [Macrococcus psychrotolerans]|uniref:Dynamin family protein n=1 Tax=Macrococcus psychrotolerans TaxID=3039389 RepID=A0AAT9P4L8_9STAP|nr:MULTISPECIES: dynamin family protein [Macrococcus]QYA31859.1 dynamin family protein [Macrococcus sp. 19Msa1099]QYA36665.1 dynamin family protein [Macrococcus caseolyticus]QYA75373.1 dynamin family protein [Macrococcus caseolyticus]
MDNKEQIKRLYQLKKEVEKSDNTLLLNQINEVIKKVYSDYIVLSFIGHFSSGKSSLINKICDEDILPSSPIPTTSNTAQIIRDNIDLIRINMDNQTYSDVESYATVKKVNTLNTDIESVEIHKQNLAFPEGTVIQDTPGIDATFKNHEQSTMKYLLISDIVFYTVEYNHVNAEKNFSQIKMMNELGVPVVLLINQIDKHDENEILFTAFKEKVEQNIKMWNLNVEAIYYTSIYASEHNQFDQLKEQLNQQVNELTADRDFYNRIIDYIERAQINYLNQRKDRLLEQLEVDEADISHALDELHIQQSLNSEQQLLIQDNRTEQLLKEVRNIVKNAYLIPFELREKIGAMLETFATNYKVGGFFNKQAKLESIQNEKIDSVIEMLNDLLDKQINFQLKNYYEQYMKYSEQPALLDDIYYHITKEDVKALSKPQPEVTKEYILIYSEQLKTFIEKKIVQQQKVWLEKFIKSINMSKLNTTNHTSDKSILFDDYLNNEKLMESVTTKNYMHYYIHLEESIDKLIDRRYVTLSINETDEVVNKQSIINDRKGRQDSLNIEVYETFKTVDYFKSDMRKLEAQLDRIHNDETKIVVFGAFSAGKSALINALLQERILISSPNPTTASITELYYGQQHFVTFKTEDMLLNKLNGISCSVSENMNTIESWIEKNKNKINDFSDEDKSFASGVIKQYHHYKAYLSNGQTIEIDKNEIDKYTAQDEHAAFVNRIKIGLENDFLKNKVIIDSPGTGSTNSRHTMETTEIIADSDLLIYVSYYNHVFTEKDKAFLSYLNEIEVMNEASENFFVINAVDLRKNDEELVAVEDYLRTELDQLNIEDRIYSVSSKQALGGYDERFNVFAEAIEHFVDSTSKIQKIHQFNSNASRIVRSAQFMRDDYKAYIAKQNRRNLQYDVWQKEPPLEWNIVSRVLSDIKQLLHEQVSYLRDKMKIQLYDVIKSEVNTSQKLNIIEKSFKASVESKLLNEFQFIVPRINKAAIQSYRDETSLTKAALIEYEIAEDIVFDSFILKLNQMKLNPIVNEIEQLVFPVVKEKQLKNMNSRNELFENIHEQSMTVINQVLLKYESYIITEIENGIGALETHIDEKNKNISEEIIEKRATSIDDSIISEIKSALKQLELNS